MIRRWNMPDPVILFRTIAEHARLCILAYHAQLARHARPFHTWEINGLDTTRATPFRTPQHTQFSRIFRRLVRVVIGCRPVSSKRWDQHWEHEVLVYNPKARCQIPAQKRLRPDAAVPPSQSDDCATEPQIQPRTLSPESDENVGILADVVARTKMQLAQEIFTLVNAQSALSCPSRNFRYMNIKAMLQYRIMRPFDMLARVGSCAAPASKQQRKDILRAITNV